MLFDIAVAWLIVAGCAVALGAMAHRNRTTGWRRKRHDVVADVLMTWAVSRETAAPTAGVHVQRDRVEAGLMALHTALGSNPVSAGASTAPRTESAEAADECSPKPGAAR